MAIPRDQTHRRGRETDTSSATRRGWLVIAALSFLGFVLLTAFVVTSGRTNPVDPLVYRAVLTARRPWATAAATGLTLVGSFPAVVTSAIASAVLLQSRTSRWTSPALLLVAVVATAAVVYLTKIAVARARPPSSTLLGPASLDYSFPSGHTADGSVVLVLAALLVAATLRRPVVRRLVPVVAAIVAVGIGLTRVYLGYHWVSDVLGGWLLSTSVVGPTAYVALTLTGAGDGPPAAGLTRLEVGGASLGPGSRVAGMPREPRWRPRARSAYVHGARPTREGG